MEFSEFIKPELLVVIPVLWCIGYALKKTALADKWIPLALGFSGVALAALWVLSSSEMPDARAWFTAAFTAIVQGVLCAGASVYGHQIVKQSKE